MKICVLAFLKKIQTSYHVSFSVYSNKTSSVIRGGDTWGPQLKPSKTVQRASTTLLGNKLTEPRSRGKTIVVMPLVTMNYNSNLMVKNHTNEGILIFL